MKKEDIYKELLYVALTNPNQIERVINSAMQDYSKYLEKIAKDIYDSCIKVYYAGYKPVEYDRHGNIKGKNLFSAKNIKFDATDESYFYIDEMLLEPYKSPYDGATREEVLDNVLNGLRGTGFTPAKKNWPKKWTVTYPNKFSKINVWTSTGTTLDDILEDYAENVIHDTIDVLYKYIDKYL